MQMIQPSELQFSLAEQSDIPELADLLTEATIRKEHLEGSALWPNPCPKEYVEDLIASRDVHISLIAGSIAATMAVSLEDPRYWGDQADDAIYIHRLAVHPAYNGMGIGGRMLDRANEYALNRDRGYIRLDCNQHLTSYYESQGFILQGIFTSVRSGYVGHQYQRPVQ